MSSTERTFEQETQSKEAVQQPSPQNSENKTEESLDTTPEQTTPLIQETIFKGQKLHSIQPPPAGEKHVYKNCSIEEIHWNTLRVEGILILKNCTLRRCTINATIFLQGFFLYSCSCTNEFIIQKSIYQQYCKLEKNNFKGRFLLRESQFQWGLHINGSTLHMTSLFEDCEFWGHTKFDHIRAEQRFEATRCQFGKRPKQKEWSKIIFSNAHFHYITIFQNCSFLFPTHFRRAHFKEEVKFLEPQFHDRITFENARCYDLLQIKGLERCTQQAYMHLGGIQLRKIKLNHEELSPVLLCLNAIQYKRYRQSIWEEKSKHHHHDQDLITRAKRDVERSEQLRYEEASQTLAELNRAFHDTFDEEGEDWSYVTQKRLERAELWSEKEFFRALWNRILDTSCRYGTSPLIVLRTALLSLSLFTTYFWLSPHHFTPGPDFPAQYVQKGTITSLPFMEALIFSFQVFTSSELVPHIDPKPSLNPWMMLESLLGYVIMMLLVITLSRKVIRS